MIVKEKSIILSDLHFEHTRWARELAFWKDELAFFQHRMEAVAARWTDKDLLISVEQFQNQFIRHNEVIDQLVHDVREYEYKLANMAKDMKDTPGNNDFDDHKKLRDRMDTQREMYNDLKKRFFAFLIHGNEEN